MQMSKNRLYTILCIAGAAMLSIVITLIAIATARTAHARSGGTCKHDPDVLTYFEEGDDHTCDGGRIPLLSVSHTSKLKCGDEILQSATMTEPTIKWTGAHKGKMYTLVMVDPDAPSKVKDVSYLHWARTSISGGSLKSGELDGRNLIKYREPTPPKGTGVHRYQFYLFLQSNGNDVELSSNKRPGFSLNEFFNNNHHLCGPVATFQYKVAAPNDK